MSQLSDFAPRIGRARDQILAQDQILTQHVGRRAFERDLLRSVVLSMKAAHDFQRCMRLVQTQAGASGEQCRKLAEAINRMGQGGQEG